MSYEIRVEKLRLSECESVWALLRRLAARLWARLKREE